jgi:hypothetical protein
MHIEIDDQQLIINAFAHRVIQIIMDPAGFAFRFWTGMHA